MRAPSRGYRSADAMSFPAFLTGVCGVICVGVVMLPQHHRPPEGKIKGTRKKTEKTRVQTSRAVRRIILLLITIWGGIQQWSDGFYNYRENRIDFPLPFRLIFFKETFCWLSCLSTANYPHVRKPKRCSVWGLVQLASLAKREKKKNVQAPHSMQCLIRCPHAIRHSEMLDRSQFLPRTHTNSIACECASADGKLWGEKQTPRFVITALSLSAQTICRPYSP